MSGPERTENIQVRACLLDRSSNCSHALTHAARRPLPEVLVGDPTMASETASCQRGRGFAERLAPLRQDTPVAIKLRGLRCHPFDRSPLARQQRHRPPSELTRETRGRPEPPQNPARFTLPITPRRCPAASRRGDPETGGAQIGRGGRRRVGAATHATTRRVPRSDSPRPIPAPIPAQPDQPNSLQRADPALRQAQTHPGRDLTPSTRSRSPGAPAAGPTGPDRTELAPRHPLNDAADGPRRGTPGTLTGRRAPTRRERTPPQHRAANDTRRQRENRADLTAAKPAGLSAPTLPGSHKATRLRAGPFRGSLRKVAWAFNGN